MVTQFNVLWLNPRDINTFPEGLMDALDDHTSAPMLLLSQHDNKNTDIESRLRQQMQADALRPMSSGMDDDPGKAALPTHDWSSDTIQEAIQYLRLNVRAVIASREQSISYHKEAGTRPIIFTAFVSTRQLRILFLVRNAIRRQR
jgi:hypothetical protein